MNLPREIFGETIVVHTPEELGLDQVEAFDAFMDHLERVQVVIDLDGTENIDSKGLTALLDTQDKHRALGGDVKLATSNASNRKILELTRLDQSLEVYDSVIEAVRSYR